MTTKAATELYLAQHNYAMEGKREGVCYNPNNLKLEDLPIIYIYGNTPPDCIDAYAMAEDGKVLGSHFCSHEGYIKHDLGFLEGTRQDLHEKSYQKHYPNGYKMEFIPMSNVLGHEGLSKAYKKNQELAAKAKEEPNEN